MSPRALLAAPSDAGPESSDCVGSTLRAEQLPRRQNGQDLVPDSPQWALHARHVYQVDGAARRMPGSWQVWPVGVGSAVGHSDPNQTELAGFEFGEIGTRKAPITPVAIRVFGVYVPCLLYRHLTIRIRPTGYVLSVCRPASESTKRTEFGAGFTQMGPSRATRVPGWQCLAQNTGIFTGLAVDVDSAVGHSGPNQTKLTDFGSGEIRNREGPKNGWTGG